MTRALKCRRIVTGRALSNARKPNSGPKQRHSLRQDRIRNSRVVVGVQAVDSLTLAR